MCLEQNETMKNTFYSILNILEVDPVGPNDISSAADNTIFKNRAKNIE